MGWLLLAGWVGTASAGDCPDAVAVVDAQRVALAALAHPAPPAPRTDVSSQATEVWPAGCPAVPGAAALVALRLALAESRGESVVPPLTDNTVEEAPPVVVPAPGR